MLGIPFGQEVIVDGDLVLVVIFVGVLRIGFPRQGEVLVDNAARVLHEYGDRAVIRVLLCVDGACEIKSLDAVGHIDFKEMIWEVAVGFDRGTQAIQCCYGFNIMCGQ